MLILLFFCNLFSFLFILWYLFYPNKFISFPLINRRPDQPNTIYSEHKALILPTQKKYLHLDDLRMKPMTIQKRNHDNKIQPPPSLESVFDIKRDHVQQGAKVNTQHAQITSHPTKVPFIASHQKKRTPVNEAREREDLCMFWAWESGCDFI